MTLPNKTHPSADAVDRARSDTGEQLIPTRLASKAA
jgi:hypothetical protein